MILYPQRLDGVHADMKAVVEYADTLLDFHIRVQEGLRTAAVQAQYVANGTSWTMNSRHLTGHAVDLLSAVDIDKDGTIELEELYAWPLAFRIAGAMKVGAVKLNVPIVWGGVWDRDLRELKDPEQAVADYVLRRKKQNRKANIDGPHFELARSKYP